MKEGIECYPGLLHGRRSIGTAEYPRGGEELVGKATRPDFRANVPTVQEGKQTRRGSVTAASGPALVDIVAIEQTGISILNCSWIVDRALPLDILEVSKHATTECRGL